MSRGIWWVGRCAPDWLTRVARSAKMAKPQLGRDEDEWDQLPSHQMGAPKLTYLETQGPIRANRPSANSFIPESSTHRHECCL